MREPIAFCWSGGKDSALALHTLREDGRFRVVELLTTVTEEFDRVSMHGVRVPLVEQQARSLGLPLSEMRVPAWPTNVKYEERLGEACKRLKSQGILRLVFGDIFLEDLREYRDQLLASFGMEAVYPLWKSDTRELIERFVAEGFRAVTVCVRPPALDATFVGHDIDANFVRRLPDEVDPCGENGEQQTTVNDGQEWQFAIPFLTGGVVERDGFLFCDLLPFNEPQPAVHAAH